MKERLEGTNERIRSTKAMDGGVVEVCLSVCGEASSVDGQRMTTVAFGTVEENENYPGGGDFMMQNIY